MADHGFGDGFGLGRGRAQGSEEGVGEHAAVEFEGEEGGIQVGGCGADVVEEAGEEVGFGGEGPVWKLLMADRLACCRSISQSDPVRL